MKRAARSTRSGSSAKAGPTWRSTLRFEVARAAERVDQAAVGGFGDRIDGEVAALQVFFQRHRRIAVDDEAAMPASGFALGARQRVFLAGLRMQEHREVAPDRPEAARLHGVRRFADHHEITIARRQAEQAVADRAADEPGSKCLH